MSILLNSTQLGFFKDLIVEVQNNNINLKDLEEVKTLPHFGFWKNALKQIFGKIISAEENLTLNQTIESYIQDLLIEYFKYDKKRFDKKLTENIFKNFLQYIKNEKNTLFYFAPLYNFEFDGDELKIDDSIKIKKISESESCYLSEFYAHFVPIKVSLSKIKYVFIITIMNDATDPSSLVEEKIFQTLNKLKILNEGDIRSGGLYYFAKSENWNPRNKFDRIKVEPLGITSNKKYVLHKKHSKEFQDMMFKMSNIYPSSKNNVELYDVLARVIRRFGGALDKKDQSEKIVDLVLCLEILLVSTAYDSTMKISQRTALFIGKNVKEKLEISNYMIAFYDFRSGQVHESKDRPVKVGTQLTKDFIIKKLELWTRRSLLQMFYVCQEKKYSKLTYREILKKIDQSIYNPKISSDFSKLNNEIIKQLRF